WRHHAKVRVDCLVIEPPPAIGRALLLLFDGVYRWSICTRGPLRWSTPAGTALGARPRDRRICCRYYPDRGGPQRSVALETSVRRHRDCRFLSDLRVAPPCTAYERHHLQWSGPNARFRTARSQRCRVRDDLAVPKRRAE